MTNSDSMTSSGTEKFIIIVLKEMQRATTAEIIERVSMFNQDCADKIPMVLTQMRLDGKITYNILSSNDGKRKNIVWELTNSFM